MTTREALRAQVMATDFAELAPHCARGALLIVAESEDLLDVALAIAHDDTKRVERWLSSQGLVKANESHARAFEARRGLRFQFLVVQPYVLAQTLPMAPNLS